MKRFLSALTHTIRRPSTVAVSTVPALALSMNSEYGTVSFGACRESNCLTTVTTTSRITSQMPTFLSRLFKDYSSRRFRVAAGPWQVFSEVRNEGAAIYILAFRDPRDQLGNLARRGKA